MAAHASSVSHDSNGIYGGIFIAALVSQAFHEADPRRLIATGLAHIPRTSEFARVVQAVLDFHRANPGDWHAAYSMVAEHFGYDRYPARCISSQTLALLRWHSYTAQAIFRVAFKLRI
jgi:hypothetical protein